MRNAGEGHGIATIQGDTTFFKPPERIETHEHAGKFKEW